MSFIHTYLIGQKFSTCFAPGLIISLLYVKPVISMTETFYFELYTTIVTSFFYLYCLFLYSVHMLRLSTCFIKEN